MIGKVFLGILALFLLFGVFMSPISDGIKAWRTEDGLDVKPLTTGEGVTTGNVTLSKDLYQASTGEIESITSSISETPSATDYDEDTKALSLSNLTANQTRNLTISYNAETSDTGTRAIGPFLLFLIIGGILAAIVFGIWHKGKR